MFVFDDHSEFQDIAGLKFSDRVRKMRTGAMRESWSEKKNNDDWY